MPSQGEWVQIGPDYEDHNKYLNFQYSDKNPQASRLSRKKKMTSPNVLNKAPVTNLVMMEICDLLAKEF